MTRTNLIITAVLAAGLGVASYASSIYILRGGQPIGVAEVSSMHQWQTEQTEGSEETVSVNISNPSFEQDDIASLSAVTNSADGLRGYTVTSPQGWTLAGKAPVSLIVTADCFTDNNFGKVTSVADGSQAYYMRVGWETGTTTLSQKLLQLPAGKYRLSAAIRSAYANSATSSCRLFAGTGNTSLSFTQGATSCFVTMPWTVGELVFTQAADADLEIGFQVDWLSGGSCIMIDDVKLQKLPDGYEEPADPTEADVESCTEGVITSDFVEESRMKDDILQMLADFALYLKNDFQNCEYTNSIGEECGAFKCNSTMNSNEDGVRSNADLSMICAFLVKYAEGKVNLPEGVTWDDLRTMARKSLIFSYSTHKANRLKVCAGGAYWGSTSASDYVWESSLWAMSVAYSAFFQWESLTEAQRQYVYALLKAECNYELERSIPTGYAGDTKAEENGWEADVLAAALGLFPDDELAPKWFARLREFAVNSYSQKDDAKDKTVIDPDYDNTTVADLYKGQNLYDDYTLQNHNYFHTSYQNVVIQELGEAALALKLFQTGLGKEEKWKTNALMHNNDKVMDEVLKWLALADGELAMPNGNDWSLFLYDQITSYSTNACFLRDADAFMLENLAYKMIQARQKTTEDGSWLLRSDIGARRMGVEAHRVMMTWLMHEMLPTSDVTPTTWEDFNSRYAEAKVITSQNIVRASSPYRFTTFSWSKGLNSYTGYIAANSVDKNKIIVPYKANNTGNFLGWYTCAGKGTNATPVVSGNYDLRGNSYVMNGELNTNDALLNNRFAIYSTPGNAVIYLDYVRGKASGTITKEQGGLMAISVDELTKTRRTFYYGDTHKQLDGSVFTTFDTDWINVDNALGIVAHNGKQMAFGEKANNNSVNTAKLYAAYSTESRTVSSAKVIDARNIIYYSNITADSTRAMSERLVLPTVPKGWNAAIVPDPDGTYYLLASNFLSVAACELTGISLLHGAPVFTEKTTVSDSKSSASFTALVNRSVANVIKFFIQGTEVEAVQESGDSTVIYIRNLSAKENNIEVKAAASDGLVARSVTLQKASVVKVRLVGNELLVEQSDTFPGDSGESTSVTAVTSCGKGVHSVHSLGGKYLGPDSDHLPGGVYIVDGRKVVKK